MHQETKAGPAAGMLIGDGGRGALGTDSIRDRVGQSPLGPLLFINTYFSWITGLGTICEEGDAVW